MNHTTPKDFFLHLSATVVLYIAAVSLVNLSFNVINYFLPDPLAGYFFVNTVAWSISMLVILVPLLYVLEWLIAKDIRHTPEKAQVWINRWRIYLTLFLAGAVVIGDVISLLNTYLNGEITARFAYKILAVFLIVGTIFTFYLLGRVKKNSSAKVWRKVLAWFGIILVLAAIVTGFMAVGSPAKQRALRFDQQRVNDLSIIQSNILYSRWMSEGSIPPTLDELNDPLSGFKVPVDPETGQSYGYTKKNTQTFELCATFGQPSQDSEGRGNFGGSDFGVSRPIYYPYPENEQWEHAAGRVCFERTIDPERYPVNPPPKPL